MIPGGGELGIVISRLKEVVRSIIGGGLEPDDCVSLK
jgi:hypothetical protein